METSSGMIDKHENEATQWRSQTAGTLMEEDNSLHNGPSAAMLIVEYLNQITDKAIAE